jgi:hypothetical protein
MDDSMKKRLDTLVEDEIARGYRIKDLPSHIVAHLERAHEDSPEVPVFTRIRFTKQTPRKRAMAEQETILRYHADIQNKALLSNAQLRELNIARGQWSEKDEERIKELQESSTNQMRDLYLEGFDQRENWLGKLDDLATQFQTKLEGVTEGEERERLLAIFSRWLNYNPKGQAQYTERYAAAQGLAAYEVDRDFLTLLEAAPDEAAQDLLTEIETLATKVLRLSAVVEQRTELYDLQVKQAKIFAGSVEARQTKTEELARLYYSTEVVNARGRPEGNLTATFDKMWDLPDEVIEWLLTEAYFFHSGIPDSARGYLEQWGFIRAERESGSPQASDESPVPPSVSSDGPPAATTPSVSSD